ncbi:hypothetical protein [Pannonibacter tanglangensis]|uniref:Uncharacterized protein n=1 Tax=Pannonibacter tanglangensis TaxID=2750084 RepID=A0ABW9ZJU8_9HYPH|nr:hypothetical protein [Pannonibacter sp. XCT-34]NBN65168.1 hypothetical protein [Pannonibacter sp. XCT-34]
MDCISLDLDPDIAGERPAGARHPHGGDGFSTFCRNTGRPCIMARLLARRLALAGDMAEALDLAETALSGRVRSGCPQSQTGDMTCMMAFTVRNGLAYVFGGVEGRERVDDLVRLAQSAYPPVAGLAASRGAGPEVEVRFGPVLVPATVQVTDLAALAGPTGAMATGRKGGRAARHRALRPGP